MALAYPCKSCGMARLRALNCLGDGMKVCAVDGCKSILHKANQAGVCRTHNHTAGVCKCNKCSSMLKRPPLDPHLNQKQTVTVIRMFRAGWGVEDIALKMGVPAAGPRSVLKRLHNMGTFKQPNFFKQVAI